MGLYDLYGESGIQLKVGPCMCDRYAVGDECPLDDGVYIAREGVVVVQDGFVVLAEDVPIVSKWGDVIEAEDILAPHDYTSKAVKEMAAKYENTK